MADRQNTSSASAASASSSSKKRPISAQDLRSFYFSRSSNFQAFQTRVADTSNNTNSSVGRSAVSKRSLIPAGSAVRAARSVYEDQEEDGTENSQHQDYYDETAAGGGGGGGDSSRDMMRPPSAAAAGGGGGGASSSSSTGRGRMQLLRASEVQGGDGVSGDYVGFLKDQQTILKSHQFVKQVLASVQESIKEHSAAFKKLTDECEELLHKAEESSDWNWRSKFTREQLVEDAALDVPFEELLRAEDVPDVSALQHLLQNMHKLRHELAGVTRQQQLADPEGKTSQRFQPFFSLLEQGTRKVERFVSEFAASHIDATPIAKLPDTLLVQLDNSLRIPPLSRILEESLLRLGSLEEKRQECIRTRETAIEEGDMAVAERQSVSLAELSEECTATIQEKIKILERVQSEHAVLQRVCASYSQGFAEAVVALEEESSRTKTRCEDDLSRLYTLKEKMTTVEHSNRDKWDKSKSASDTRLRRIDEEQTHVWEELQKLATRFAALEDQRHAECKARVEEKAAEEGRRNDFDVFVRTLDDYSKSLERTVSDMDLRYTSTQIMADFVRGGFTQIQKDITNLKNQVDGELFEGHKAHLSAFRNLIFILGELEYRHERRVEEIGSQIQNAHIQLELCSDSLNAQAKRYADERNELTKRLHHVEHDVELLRQRQQSALALFAPSASALSSESFEFEHPLTELEEWKLETRARMVDFRAVAVGGVKSKPLRENLNALASSLEESRSRLFTNSRMSPGGGAQSPARRMLQ